MLQGVLNVPSQVTHTFIGSAAVRYTAAGLIGIAVMKLIDFALKKYQDSNPLNEFPKAFRAPLKKIGCGKWANDQKPTFKEMDNKGVSVATTTKQGWPSLLLKVTNNGLLDTIQLVFVGSHTICDHPAFENAFLSDLESPREKGEIEVGTKGLDSIVYRVTQVNTQDNKTMTQMLSLLNGKEIETNTGRIALAAKKFLPLSKPN